jgi:hypothetical protein
MAFSYITCFTHTNAVNSTAVVLLLILIVFILYLIATWNSRRKESDVRFFTSHSWLSSDFSRETWFGCLVGKDLLEWIYSILKGADHTFLKVIWHLRDSQIHGLLIVLDV